jgi:hypothetical protein
MGTLMELAESALLKNCVRNDEAISALTGIRSSENEG